MDAKQLRIGNYVYRENSKLINQKDDVYQIENVNRQSASKYDPIPLTEEWLLKLGFEIEGLRSYYNAELDLTVEFINGKYAFTICDQEHAPAITHYIMHCEFVHTFQNNAYAITSKELTIKN